MRFIPVAKPNISIAEASAVFQVIKNGWISMGKKVNQFEKNISKFTNVKYVVAMNNGTSTLDALLTALDISKDDEVIVPNLTYISTANVVSYLGRKDKLALTKDRVFSVIEGVSSDEPILPADDEDAMTLYNLDIPPYTSMQVT